jgi:hypothetical protein
MVDGDTCKSASASIRICNLDPDLIVSIGRCTHGSDLLKSIFRVTVVQPGSPGGDLPDVFGRYQVLEDGIRYIPHFPFEPEVHYRVSFDPRMLARPELGEILTLEFSLPREASAVPTVVKQVYPSSDSLPENLLRFYVCFSTSMQRGRSVEHIALLGPDGRPAPDVLYRAPVELWDRSMQHLTILLDPGRLKRGLGPNVDLGPPLKAGQEYTLAVSSGMVDLIGRPLQKTFYKHFRVTEAVREPVAIAQWKISPPIAESLRPLVLIFSRPLDWALLSRTIIIESRAELRIEGRIVIDQGERRWSFTPTLPWAPGSYHVRVASGLEDVCGNSVMAAFDRPVRSGNDLVYEVANLSIAIHLV